MRFIQYSTLAFGLVRSINAIGQAPIIAFSPGDKTMQLSGNGSAPSILLDGAEWPGVIRTANDLAVDFGRVTGVNGTVLSTNNTQHLPKSGLIIAGTIGKSNLITKLVKAGKIDVSNTEGQWEAFTSKLVSNPLPGVSSALVIAGADKRGTIYGLYDVSEQIGVSPW